MFVGVGVLGFEGMFSGKMSPRGCFLRGFCLVVWCVAHVNDVPRELHPVGNEVPAVLFWQSMSARGEARA